MSRNIPLTIGLYTMSLAVHAASFDCRKAGSLVEQAICADPGLSAADERLGRLYRKALADTRDPDLSRRQREWLEQRDACRNAQCLKDAYAARLAHLADPPLSAAGWAGEWHRSDSGGKAGAGLKVTEVGPTQFRFEFTALGGARAGKLEGIARIARDSAIFQAPNGGCRLEFTLAEGAIRVVASPLCAQSAGLGVDLDGNFARGTAPSATASLLARGVFQDIRQEEDFKALVGMGYPLFCESFQLIHDETDLDEMNAAVFSGGVRGLFTIMEGIIMYTPTGFMYAAAIDGDVVRYYSSDPAFRKRLPRTIDEWRSRFPEKKVVFESQ